MTVDRDGVEVRGSAEGSSLDTFVRRHVGPGDREVPRMLKAIGASSLEELIDQTVPADIRLSEPLNLPEALGETAALEELQAIARRNKVCRSFIGMGYYDTITPAVLLRNILENPGWYTQYTPYQAEISQGRLEVLLNFQTMVSDLTSLPMSNASMLDEGTAAAEAMRMCHATHNDRSLFFVARDCHPQTIAVVRTRAKWLKIEVIVGDAEKLDEATLRKCSGILVQYPTTEGRIVDYSALTDAAHDAGALVVAATDLLALALIKPPGEWGASGADIAVGSAQRFGVPLGFGGPHAAFMASKNEFTRKLPGRIVGVSKDAHGSPAYRLAIQTREQHIRREKATSNICTAQVLLAIMASMYAVYHGPEGLKAIAREVRVMAQTIAQVAVRYGHAVQDTPVFDTVRVALRGMTAEEFTRPVQRHMNFRILDPTTVCIAVDEATTWQEVGRILSLLAGRQPVVAFNDIVRAEDEVLPARIARTSPFLTHPVFNQYHSEHELLRYLYRLQAKDLSLTTSMIPLGSCTMKLNATSEMIPITWPEFSRLHPYAPADQARGYQELFKTLETWLAEITGLAAVSLQPNAGSQGEYAGLLAIRAYQEARGQGHRDVCLIPTSAHGTNPASAVTAGLKVVAVACDAQGNVDLADLRLKAFEHRDRLSCIMVTYPSTHGVFEESIRDICKAVHDNGGQVYMDGANMNAQVGLTSPGAIGADVCHLNLHKTFCIPHGGGGPGMGPIAVAQHLAPFLPGHPLEATGNAAGPVSAAPWGSASILPISWMYIRMMGAEGLKRASQIAILNANYMAKRLENHFPILYRGKNGRCAHEFIVDCRHFEDTAGVKVDDIAKRLMDYGFHAPTMSWPVAGTLMFEPTESESRAELDRLCEAMIRIREEIHAIEVGRMDREDNPLRHAPHTARAVSMDGWPHKYSRQLAAYPAPWTHGQNGFKFWPAVGRIDNPYGDRHLVCTCPPVNEF